MHVGILAIEIGDVLKSFLPGGVVDLQGDGGIDGGNDRSFGEIIDRICFGAELLERGLFFGERFARGFVGVVGSQPDLVAESDGIVVEGKNVVSPMPWL